jgi:cytochrome b6-f complex iron-sulfur subunit
MPEMRKLNRRLVLRAGLAAVGCSCVGGVSGGCSAIVGRSKTPTPPEGALKVEGEVALIDIDKVPSLAGAEASVKFEVPGLEDGQDPIKVLVVRLDERYEAFVNTCTHGGRELEFLPDVEQLRCVSVGHSEFDETGRTLSGPAQENLTLLSIQQRGRTLAISLT